MKKKNNNAECIEEDLKLLSLNFKVINEFVPQFYKYKLGNYWAGTKIQIAYRGYTITGMLHFEINSKDKKGREWQNKFFFTPQAAHKNELELNLPDLVKVGYQIFVQKYGDRDIPNVRIDSLCLTSMIDGHQASARNEELGCDCDKQRCIALDVIHRYGGVSILSPFEGRGNGFEAHVGQIQVQNFARRQCMCIPNTYDAVAMLGYKKDRRERFYWLDAMVLKLVTSKCKIFVYSNNPEKMHALSQFGFIPQSKPLLDIDSNAYYNGINYQAKVVRGKLFTNIDRNVNYV